MTERRPRATVQSIATSVNNPARETTKATDKANGEASREETLAVREDHLAGAGPWFVVRCGTFYLVIEHDHSTTKANVGLAQDLVDALEADPRVTSSSVPELDPVWSPQYTAYPWMEDLTDDDGVRDGRRHFHVQRFSKPLSFTVHVPKKNQPVTHADDEVPTEDYFALWDGQSLLTCWQADSDRVGWGGGHVIAEIVTEAAEKIGCRVYSQACEPNCEHMFLHVDLATKMHDSGPRWKVEPPTDSVLTIRVDARGSADAETAARAAWRHVNPSLRDFAFVKNAGRHVLDLEKILRYDLDRLATLHHEVAEITLYPWTPPLATSWRPRAWTKTRVPALWKARGWRKTSRVYLSQLWLSIGNLERARRLWSRWVARFDEEAAKANIAPLFKTDAANERMEVETLDVSLIESGIEHAAARLDANAVTRATLGGAVAGAIVAAVVALIH